MRSLASSWGPWSSWLDPSPDGSPEHSTSHVWVLTHAVHEASPTYPGLLAQCSLCLLLAAVALETPLLTTQGIGWGPRWHRDGVQLLGQTLSVVVVEPAQGWGSRNMCGMNGTEFRWEGTPPQAGEQ